MEIPKTTFIKMWMKPIEQLIAQGDAELFSERKLKEMLMEELKTKDYDELKWKTETYLDTRYLNPIRVVRVTTFRFIKDLKELENSTLVY